tara:strand:+ start:1640 stop:3190 length:1551 start_codon:yes stop_codon:yes gene_type:complete
MPTKISYDDLPSSTKKGLSTTSIPDNSLTTSQVFSQAGKNFIPSSTQFAKDLITPFLQPIQTAEDLYSLASGVVQLAIPGKQENEDMARAVGDYFADRYGDLEKIKIAFANDPVGVVADITAVLTGGGALVAKTGKLSKIGNLEKSGNVIKNTAQFLDPALLPLKTVKLGSAGVREITGKATGVSGVPIREAYQAGKKSLNYLNPTERSKAKDFRKALTSSDNVESLAMEARDAFSKMTQEKKSIYKSGMSQIRERNKPIDFEKVKSEIAEVRKDYTDEGMLILSDGAKNKLTKIDKLVSDFEKNPKLHTASGLDALKRMIDKLYDYKVDPDDVSSVVANSRNRIKNIIVDETPDYAEVMKEFEKASMLEAEIGKSLGVKNSRATADLTLRRLQQALRDNANTGTKLKNLRTLDEVTDANLTERLAGQALSPGSPRGIAGALHPITFLTLLGSGNQGAIAGLLAAQSPRLIGELAYGSGKVGAVTSPILTSAPYLRTLEAAKEDEKQKELLRLLSE